MSNTKEISFIDLILNFWKFKVSFFIILVSLSLLSILLDNFIPKKDSVEIRLKKYVLVDVELYPINRIYTFELNLSKLTANSDDLLLTTNLFELNFIRHFLEKNLTSQTNLLNFAKANDNKLYEYITKNNISVKKAMLPSEDWEKYVLILPKNENNKIFFKEYFDYAIDISLKEFQDQLIELEIKKLKLIKKEAEFIERSFFNSDVTTSLVEEELKKNLYAIQNIQKTREIKINENINTIKDTVKKFDSDLVLESILIRNLGEKFYRVTKFTLPVILSLIIYLLYILVKLSKQNNQN